MAKQQMFKENDFVWVKSLKTKGRIKTVNRDMGKTYLVEIIVDFNKETGERTTKLEKVKVEDLTLYRERKQKLKNRKKDVLYFAKVKEDAIIPSKDYENAGYDIYANFEENEIFIFPNEVKLIPTGIASAMSPKYVLIVKERGSTGTKCMSVRSGVIDASYRGEIFIPINNTGNKTIVITKTPETHYGNDVIVYPYTKAIAQLLLLPIPNVDVKEIIFEQLQKIPSKRGAGALGSSGK
jgi:dUTP pyrophosphatase